MVHRVIEKCRLTGAGDLIPVASVGNQSLTGVFIKPDDEEPPQVPLDLVYCPDSMFLQLRYTVDSDLMYSNYWYRSGTNQIMRDHLKGIVDDAINRVQLNSDDAVIDIGCNDGTLLRNYNQEGLTKIGIDPSDAIKSIQLSEGIKTYNGYFNAVSAKSLLKNRKAKIITAISMFYDLDDPRSFVSDIESCLHEDGIWIVEMNYTGDMIQSLGYDMISHEHVAYYTLLSFEKMLETSNLHVVDVTKNPINGGSIRLFISWKNKQVTQAVSNWRDEELGYGYDKVDAFLDFGDRVEALRNRLVTFVRELKEEGKTIAAYGASTRGNTVMQYCGFSRDDIYAALDRNPIKWGLEMSGCRIPIISEEEGRNKNPDYMMVLPYYFIEEFLERERSYLENGGKFILFLPKLKIISLLDGELVEELIE